jgi:TetR/AcrR family transcriptional regulator
LGVAQTKKEQGQATRQAILAAADALFAEHGFDGTRVDSIAALAGHNKTLIFRYFGNKLGLYAEVLKRADQEMGVLLARLFAPLVEDPTIVAGPRRFKAFLEGTIGAFFDYMVGHPRLARMLNWEQAAGWQTLDRLASQFEPQDFSRLTLLFRQAQAAGLLRADLDVVLAVLLVLQLCWSVPNSLALYEMFPAGRDAASSEALDHIRTQVIALSVTGMLAK